MIFTDLTNNSGFSLKIHSKDLSEQYKQFTGIYYICNTYCEDWICLI